MVFLVWGLISEIKKNVDPEKTVTLSKQKSCDPVPSSSSSDSSSDSIITSVECTLTHVKEASEVHSEMSPSSDPLYINCPAINNNGGNPRIYACDLAQEVSFFLCFVRGLHV